MHSSAASATAASGTAARAHVNGGRFDFDDGGTYCGGWEEGKAHGHGVCTGPKGQGAYSGSWHYGYEVSGVYTWPSGSTYEGQWQNGKRHGLGVETRGRWLYRGEWTLGYKGRYGVRQSSTSNAKYGGTWSNGVQDGYGSETYADGGDRFYYQKEFLGTRHSVNCVCYHEYKQMKFKRHQAPSTYQGQWLRGMRHGYGVRTSAPFGLASHYRPNKSVRASLTSLRSNEGGGGETNPAADRDRRMDDSRGGFVLRARSDPSAAPARRRSLVEKSSSNFKNMISKMRKQRSLDGEVERGKAGTTGSLRSTASSASWVSTESYQSGVSHHSAHTDSNASFVVEDEMMDKAVTETYMGEWKNDKRSGFGIAERSDGLKYEGEWFNNKKYGYGVTTFKDATKEEGKYKNNVLITSQKKKHLFLIRSAKFRERIDAAVNSAQRASKFALQKADIAISRAATARGKGELADTAADVAREDSDIATATAQQFAPDFQQPMSARARPTLRSLPRQRSVDVQPPISPVLPEPPKDNVLTNIPSTQYLQPPQTKVSLQPPVEESYAGMSAMSVAAAAAMSTAAATVDNRSLRGASVRRNSQPVSGEPPGSSFQQAMSDHFDHYKRPPSREPSVDRMSVSKGARASLSSRQPSVDKTIPNTGNGAVVGAAVASTSASTSTPQPYVVPSAEPAVRRRTPAPDVAQPKRTESLFVNSSISKGPAPKGALPAAAQPLQRKKSLPDVQALPKAVQPMSREEASVLSSARREHVRQVQEESEKLRANPLLYFVSPHFRDWFSRQQLIMLVLFINISLVILFYKLLT